MWIKYPGVELLDYERVLVSNFGGTTILFYTIAVLIYIPNDSILGLSLGILSSTCCIWSLNNSFSYWSEAELLQLWCISKVISGGETFV